MFQHVIGIDAFQTALKNYIVDRSFNTTNTDYLFHHLQQSVTGSGVNLPDTIKALFETLSNNPGYPLVKVTRNNETRTILFEQSRFFANPSEATGASFPDRWIPINFATAVNRNFENTSTDFWMSPQSSTASRTIAGPNNDNWIVVNKQVTSYYRVQYDQHNYDLLISAVNSEHFSNIDVLNRAQLLDDAINLAKARLIDIKIAFSFLKSLRRENDLPNAYAPWATANNALGYLDRFLRGHAVYEKFQSFVANISSEAYGNVQVNTVLTRHLHRIHRLSVAKWACLSGLEACLKDVNEIVNGMLNGSFKIIDEIKDFVYCSAVKNSEQLTQSLREYALTLFIAPRPNNIEEIYRLVSGLTCSTNQEVINSYLELTIISNQFVQLTPSDYIYIFKAIASGTSEGLSTASEFLSRNFQAVRSRYGTDAIADIFTYLGPLMNAERQISLLENIVSTYTSTLTNQQQAAASTAISRARENVEWLEYHQKSISDWLTMNVEPITGAAAIILLNSGLSIVTLMILQLFF